MSAARNSSMLRRPVSAAPRADGYTNETANIVCKFQALMESDGACNYGALRAALKWARETSEEVTLISLMAQYDYAC